MRYLFCALFLSALIIGICDLDASDYGSSNALMPRGDYPNKMILFCIDDQDMQLDDPIAITFITAFYQAACPIVVSKALLRIMLMHKLYNSDVRKQFEKIEKVAPSLSSTGTPDESLRGYNVAHLIALYTTDLSKWSFYEINAGTYLLVPAHFLQGHTPLLRENVFMRYLRYFGRALWGIPAMQTKPGDISEREFSLGLKVDHLRQFSYQDILPSKLSKFKTYAEEDIKKLHQEELKHEERAHISFMKALQSGNIFISWLKYQKANKSPLQWTIYCRGHGTEESRIAALSFDEFRQMLSFFNTTLKIRLLLVYSCFSGGEHAERIYTDAEKAGKSLTFSFPIIVSALPDLVNAQFTTNKISFEWKDGQLSSHLPQRIDLAYNAISTNEPAPYDTLLSFILSDMNFPYIRFAGREQFMPLFPAVNIGDIMARNRKNPLIIRNAPKKAVLDNKLRIIFDTLYVPFMLDFSRMSDEVKIFLASGLTGSIFHTLEQVKTDKDILSFLSSITLVPIADKGIKIVKLTTKNRVYDNVVIVWNVCDDVCDDKLTRHIFAQYRDSGGETKTVKFVRTQTGYSEEAVDDRELGLYCSYIKQSSHEYEIEKYVKIGDVQKLLKNINKIVINTRMYRAILASLSQDADIMREVDKIVLDQFINGKSYDTYLVLMALKNGANVNQIGGEHKYSLLMSVINCYNDIALIRTLLQYNANTEYVSKNGNTALSLARRRVESWHIEHDLRGDWLEKAQEFANAKAIVELLENHQKKIKHDLYQSYSKLSQSLYSFTTHVGV